MKKEQTETKLKPTLGLTRHLISGVVYFGALILSCSSASAQNLFAVDADSDGFAIIDEFTPNGVRSTFASGLNHPSPPAFDEAGNLFVADSGVIYKFTPTGVRTTFASGLNYPSGLAFDKAGNLFVADAGTYWPSAGSGAVYKFTPAGVRTTFASGLNPDALLFDSAGNLFVTDSFWYLIYKFTPTGARTTFASLNTPPVNLAFDRAGNLFVADGGTDLIKDTAKIYKFTPGGVRTNFASGLFEPFALAFDSAGNLFVADGGSFEYDWPPKMGAAVYKFTPSGQRSTVASQNDQDPVFPDDLAIDGADNLFVLASGNILKFTPSGVRTTFASGVRGPLAFQPPQTPTPTLVNISARGSVETGENVLISGFIVTGSDSKPVIVRALGPTLTSFGVADALQDPDLELHNSTSMMTHNDDWPNAATANQVPMSYRPTDIRESAFMTTLPPGAYTTVLSGKNGTTGNGLLEVYSTSSGLSNASIRGFVGTGDHVLIGGFGSSGGNSSLQVIIRALGPTLTQFGVNGALADPTLSLIDGNGNVVAFNDNWKNTQQTVIQATGFAPPNDPESAILATLPNGNYTAIVAGKNGATGVGLLEVYKLR